LLCYSNTHRGFTLSYGAFQAYYKDYLLSSSSDSAISWIGTVQGWLLILVGVLSGPLFDLGYFRSMLLVGNFLVVFGIMMLSLCTTYWQVFLTQAICMGLGAGLLYVPSLALIGIWFERRRALAMGIVMSGIAVGKYNQYSVPSVPTTKGVSSSSGPTSCIC
jgi:MFS family permease